MTKKLEGKCILITGGSRGVGKATAIEAAKEGAVVLFTYHENECEAAKVLETILEAGGKAHTFSLPLEHPEKIEQTMHSIFQNFKIDILVNNAAILIRKHLLNTTVADLDKVYQANLRGPFILSQLVAKNMIANKTNGLIINISSDRAITMTDGLPSYQIMKAGLNMMTQVFARSLAKANIRAITISPGVVRTDMQKHLWEQGMVFWKQKNNHIPLGAAEPEQIAKFITSIASDAASYVNGANLVIDGGRTVGTSTEELPEIEPLRAKL